MAASVSKDHFIVHWLDLSRAHRIVWLLEILELDYEVKIYLRDAKTWRSPPELKAIHPLGKAPILEIVYADGRPTKKLAESGHIFQYILKHYDTSNLLTPLDPEEQEEVDYFLHYCEGSLQHILVSILVNSVARKVAPIGTKTVAKYVTKAINNGFYIQEWKLNMEYLENRLKQQGTGYFVGNQLTGADIMLSFPIYENIFDNEEEVHKFIGVKVDLAKTYPHLYAWSRMIADDPLYIKIDEMMEDLVEAKISRENRTRR